MGGKNKNGGIRRFRRMSERNNLLASCRQHLLTVRNSAVGAIGCSTKAGQTETN